MNEDMKLGIEQSAAGEVVDLGSFAKYLSDDERRDMAYEAYDPEPWPEDDGDPESDLRHAFFGGWSARAALSVPVEQEADWDAGNPGYGPEDADLEDMPGPVEQEVTAEDPHIEDYLMEWILGVRGIGVLQARQAAKLVLQKYRVTPLDISVDEE